MSSQPPHKVIHLPKLRMAKGPIAQSSIRITNVSTAKPSYPELEIPRPHTGIRITNVTSIKPPDPELVKKQEEEKLRAQLQKEIVSRSRTCANSSYFCGVQVVSGRRYCGRHILQDTTAPYKQCAYTYSNGEQCQMPGPADREHAMCFEHARAALHSRMRSTAPPPPVTTTETLLTQLAHYIRPERTRTTSCASSVSVVSDPSDQDQIFPSAVDPFKQIDAPSVNASYSAAIMECASASDSDCDSVTLGPEGSCRAGPEEEDIYAEDSLCEDQPLWRAGVFTVEEAVSEAKNVLKTLQKAYIGQMGRLRTLLQCARLNYLKALKAEKEQYCSINAQSKSGPLTVRERKQLRKLKAYASYRRKHGADAVLARKLARKRARLSDSVGNRAVPSAARCTFAEGGVRCAAAVLPAAKHCLKHILHDQQQVLFYECGDRRGCGACQEPVPRLPLPSPACRYHTDPPAYTPFTLKKDDSDDDSESRSISSSATELGTETFYEGSEVADGYIQSGTSQYE